MKKFYIGYVSLIASLTCTQASYCTVYKLIKFVDNTMLGGAIRHGSDLLYHVRSVVGPMVNITGTLTDSQWRQMKVLNDFDSFRNLKPYLQEQVRSAIMRRPPNVLFKEQDVFNIICSVQENAYKGRKMKESILDTRLVDYIRMQHKASKNLMKGLNVKQAQELMSSELFNKAQGFEKVKITSILREKNITNRDDIIKVINENVYQETRKKVKNYHYGFASKQLVYS